MQQTCISFFFLGNNNSVRTKEEHRVVAARSSGKSDSRAHGMGMTKEFGDKQIRKANTYHEQKL